MAARLTNTYQQYKTDTRVFVSWLATAAKANGWSDPSDDAEALPSLLESASLQPPASAAANQPVSSQDAKKKKKKTKKKGNSATAGGPVPTSSAQDTPVRYTVAIEDFIPMAKLVRSSHKNAKSPAVPSSIANTLERVIRLRKAFAHLYHQTFVQICEQEGDISDEDSSTDTHSYFVDVLRHVQHILCDGITRVGSPPPDPASPRQCLSAAFSALHLYEPSQSFLDAPGVVLPSGPEYDIAEDEDNLEEDAQVAFAALLQDVLVLRKQVNKLWRERYIEGHLHLAAVAVATNTAIDLARKMEEETAAILDRFGGVGEFLENYFATANEAAVEEAGGDYDSDDLDPHGVAKRTMYEAYDLLDDFRESCPAAADLLPLYGGEPCGWYDPAKAKKCRSAAEKTDRDRAGFSEMISEIAILDRRLKWNNVQDELTRGVRLIMADVSKPVPFWVVFAAQIFIDNLEILGGDELGGRVWASVANISRWINNRMEIVLDMMDGGKPRPPGWPAKKDTALRRLQQDAQFLENDTIAKFKRRIQPSIKRPESILMKHNAVFAGVWAHHLLTLLHTTGIAYVNAWGAVFAMAQLNTAVMRLAWMETRRPPEVKWTDMLLMTHMQGDQRFWVGEKPPTDIKEFWKQWCLCQGVSLVDFTASGGALPIGTNNANLNARRGLAQLAPVSLLFRGRLGSDAAGHARVNMTLEDVRRIVDEGEWIVTDPSPGNVFETVHEYDRASNRPFRSQGENSNTRRRGGAQGSNTRADHLTLSPAGLIKGLANTLHAEIAELHFDYLALHEKCWLVLADFKRIMDPLFRRICEGRPDYIESEAYLPQLVGIMFRAAAGKAPGLGVRDGRELLDAARMGLTILLDQGMNRLVVDELLELGIPVELEVE
ncbi:hypothetical protein B0H63DRAFT_480788 [Podospora didyma]|uniref:DUF6604 domain-containing protein n=1 Tax=Podospora didyma TaxID=330526 RepID=A0AAE0N909_9PEZI|nr:hypothetical protein B0H63DRAFT_480788 [Podospora didyma]